LNVETLNVQTLDYAKINTRIPILIIFTLLLLFL